MTKTFILETDMTLINQWRENQPAKKIKIDNIEISHRIHRDAEEITLGIDCVLSAYNSGRPVPIIIREVDKGSFQLLFGLKQLLIAKSLNHTKINSIIVTETREDFISKMNDPMYGLVEYSIKDIKISPEFERSIPSDSKIKNKTKEIRKGIIPPLEIDHNTGTLIDGYITYLILYNMGVDTVSVKAPKKSA